MENAIVRDTKKSMKTDLLRMGLTGLLLCAAAAASAAEPVTLTDKQMDSVSAGYQRSYSDASASALFGFATTASQTTAYSNGPVSLTSSTSTGLAGGIGASAGAGAGTVFR